MNNSLRIFAAASLALTGCVRTPFPTLDEKIDNMKGQPVRAVIDKLGSPQSVMQAGGEKVYVWSAGGLEALGSNCTVKVFANREDKVTRYGYDGTVAGCGYYAHRLDEKFDTFRSTTPMPPSNSTPAPPAESHNSG
jgi:hypothetical protein